MDREEGLVMGIIRELKVRARQIAGPVIGVSMVVYFAYHAIQGDRGLIALGKLRQNVEALQAEVLDVRAERMAMERKVDALRVGSLDPDLLEERARIILGFGYPDEMDVILSTPPIVKAIAKTDDTKKANE